MSFFEKSLVGRKIDRVYVDSEVTYLVLSDGTLVSIRGMVFVEPPNIAEFVQETDTAPLI
jgi:hypothetical protein